MDFYYFAFVHYILITIIFFSRSAYISVNITETPNKKKGYGIDQENMATNGHIEQEKWAE